MSLSWSSSFSLAFDAFSGKGASSKFCSLGKKLRQFVGRLSAEHWYTNQRNITMDSQSFSLSPLSAKPNVGCLGTGGLIFWVNVCSPFLKRCKVDAPTPRSLANAALHTGLPRTVKVSEFRGLYRACFALSLASCSESVECNISPSSWLQWDPISLSLSDTSKTQPTSLSSQEEWLL